MEIGGGIHTRNYSCYGLLYPRFNVHADVLPNVGMK